MRLTLFSKIVNLFLAIHLALTMLLSPNPAYAACAKTEHASLEIQEKLLLVSIETTGAEQAFWTYKDDAGDGGLLTLTEKRFIPDETGEPTGTGRLLFTLRINRFGIVNAHCYAEIPRTQAGVSLEVRTLSFAVACDVFGKAYLSDVKEASACYP